MRVRLTAGAEVDLEEGAAFYDEIESGTGDLFLHHLHQTLSTLSSTAGIHSRLPGGFYKIIATPRFPWAAAYRIEGDTVIVYAVYDGRRDPGWIRDHLDGSSPHA